ncbi:hypothetical protein OESDEN_24673 [Oesophagostomum dentatum]|uniref:Uncharacterized protein n=1 Tax=Oesophagostomum dentatum TaxID=61180 RepID=A0A0B1RVP8_OESDE|nr:hypothetical protein OESDEN_24673 [Oesophagostomum dentatum]
MHIFSASANNISSSLSTLPSASDRGRDLIQPRRTLVKGHAFSTVNNRML